MARVLMLYFQSMTIAPTIAMNAKTQSTAGPEAPRNLTGPISNSIRPDVASNTKPTQNAESAARGTPITALISLVKRSL